MLTIASNATYQKHREARIQNTRCSMQEFWLPLLLFGSMGAITWAIRGTAGWGGVDGTVVPGLMWGLLWYYLCYRKGIDARGIVFWLGLGIALGGELGYGQYVSWIMGRFHVGEKIIPISPWIGYAWLVICGIGWAAPGGIMLGWALGGQASTGRWIVRSLLLIALWVILFAPPFIDWLGAQFVRIWPGLLFPNASLGLYAGMLDKHLVRTVYTNTQNFVTVVWWVMALLVAAFQRDRTTLVTGLVIGAGFGPGFMQSTLWCLGYDFAPHYIDWWKMWELNAGFNLGLLYVIVLYWATRQMDKTQPPDGIPFIAPENAVARTRNVEWITTLFLAVGGSLLIFFMSFEYFFWTGIFLSLFYFFAMFFAMIQVGKQHNSQSLANRRKNISLAFSTFLLVFLMFHGGSERAGILLELYPGEAVDQYAWPGARIALFAPVALLLVSVTLFRLRKILRAPAGQDLTVPNLPERMVDLMTAMGFIGALSIWPEKIGVLYALFIFLALFAFTRINRRLDLIDAAGARVGPSPVAHT
jgi:hypothetical protein